MEINLNIFTFRERMDKLADKLIFIFSKSESDFRKLYVQLPIPIKLFLFDLYERTEEPDDDVEEKWLEIFNYYYAKLRLAKKVEFTLRSAEHLKRFEKFLDKLILLMDNFPNDFVYLFPQCPEIYWDKIDDLRETSFKPSRDSIAFKRCLFKSKKLSFGYEKLMGIEEKIDNEKEEDDIEYEEI